MQTGFTSWRERGFCQCVQKMTSRLGRRLPGGRELLALKLWWGNPGYSAGTHYLRHLCRATETGWGGILECGSGLSTIIGGAVAQRSGRRWMALENHAPTRRRMRFLLSKLDLQAVTVLAAPIISYGGYDWYQAPTDLTVEGGFNLVVCDGPPWHTRGGRFGLLPIMGARLRPGCRILLDDAYRPAERQVIRHWKNMADLDVRFLGAPFSYAEITVNDQPAS